ncbi:MAG: nitrile hydratase subunit beta [Rhodospirillaceae bacterium]|jgi:nitrile hydratase|nr:nitrile hydratase subunit beta [Rhodospirillaceae bacterium]MBT3493511.1 nitrile hydratase subunit beta [Rhodospirillaceae bacterium]MBT3779025.1 nitrile hydratase subunit beta [Rhodospirillaceae bacterium]MBT3976850.1 nitrile hydratase subunit beta [Rhodospirillaceae bacterium]MBT4168274.1 nitrile hydratase subunit beta [Rhodospirillaceae bacterium]
MNEVRDEVDLAQLIRDDDGEKYAHQAAARSIAMVMKLHEQGHYDWPEWVDKFSVQIAPPGHYAQTAAEAAAAEAVLSGDGKSINRNYAALWQTACENLLVEKGLLSRDELDAKLAELQAGQGANKGFVVGDQVLVRDVEPIGHAHLPLFLRGRKGIVIRRMGDFTFPAVEGGDSEAKARGPQAVYGIRFAARDVWGPKAAAGDSLNFNIWRDYLVRG